jgi:RND family efflux transporter MFP subunit
MFKKCNPSPMLHPRTYALSLTLLLAGYFPQATAADLPTITARSSTNTPSAAYEGRVEAVRQAQIAAQVPGTVIELNVHAGDRVRAGQTLLRIDARASDAQMLSARAQLDVTAKELARKQQLFVKHYISQAALDQAEASYKAAQAQANAAQTQTAFHVVQAPFDGIVAQVEVERGDMAMPGKPLLTVYDPTHLRVSAAVPTTALAAGLADARVTLGAQTETIAPVRVQALPTVDAASLTREVRADLPTGLPSGVNAVPGLFARLLLAGASQPATAGAGRLYVPRGVVVRRAEMTGLYVLGQDGMPRLRQIRLGATMGDEVEVLSGLDAGERVVADPQAATRAASEGGSK